MHAPIVEKNKVICELSYNKLQPFMIFLDTLKVIKFTNNEIILDLRDNDKIKDLFNDIDEHIIELIKERKLVKMYDLKKFTYIPLINSYKTNSGDLYDVLKLNINMFGDYKTSMFFKYGEPVTNLSVMQTEINVKTIVECFNLTFNKDNKTIYLDNCVRQLKVKQLRPIRIKEMDYSFVDSDNESSVLNKNFTYTLDKIYENEENKNTDNINDVEEDEGDDNVDDININKNNVINTDYKKDSDKDSVKDEDEDEDNNLSASDLKEIDALRMFNENNDDSDDSDDSDNSDNSDNSDDKDKQNNDDIFENTSETSNSKETSSSNFGKNNDSDDSDN